MSEIKPVYQRRIQDDDWQEIEHSEYVEFSERGKFQTRILYPAAAYEALQKENDRLTKCLIGANANHEQFERQYYLELNKVEDLTAESAAQAKRIQDLEGEDKISAAVIDRCVNLLAQIAITLKGEPEELTRHGYHDLPELVAVLHLENELNKVQMQEMLTAMRRAVLALAFAAEKSNAMKDDYNALSAAINKAVASKNGE